MTTTTAKNIIPAAVAETLEIAPGTERQNLEGWIPEMAAEDEIRQALDLAFNYRGDVTLTLKSGEKLNCYIFDRRPAATLATSVVRVIPQRSFDGFIRSDSSQKRNIAYAEIAGLAFSGRDTAAGKTWEAWLKMYWSKKNAGEANIALEPEKL